jgi:hypothetical protein
VIKIKEWITFAFLIPNFKILLFFKNHDTNSCHAWNISAMYILETRSQFNAIIYVMFLE